MADGALTYYGAARRFGAVPVPADAGETEKTAGGMVENAQDRDGKKILDPETYPLTGE